MGPEPRIVPFEEVTRDDLTTLVRAVSSSRYLVEEPYVGPTPGRYLVDRIVGDSRRDDAVAHGMVVDDELTGLVVLRFPEWDREHFGFPVGRVEHLEGRDTETLSVLTRHVRAELEARATRMCSARISADALAALSCLEDVGFRFQESTLTPWRDLTGWEQRSFGVTRPMAAEDLAAVCGIARRAFRTDRFHRDPRFTTRAADGVYERWITTWYATPSPGRLSRVLIADGRVSGFFLFEVVYPLGAAGAAMMSLVLDAVDPLVAGHGLGFKMYCDVIDIASRTTRYAGVTVAAANPAVINLYMKLGFRLTSSGEVTLHWWSQREGTECASL